MSFDIDDEIRILWHDGSIDDPYTDEITTAPIINSKLVLDFIPDPFSHVTISGYNEIYTGEPSATEFLVNYNTGVILFNSSAEGTTVTASFKSRGVILFPAERIFLHNENPNVVDTLQDLVDTLISTTLTIIEVRASDPTTDLVEGRCWLRSDL